MRKALLSTLLLVLAFATSADSIAQTTTATVKQLSTTTVRAALARSIGDQRAAKLMPVMEKQFVSVLSDADAGFAIVGERNGQAIVYGYGDRPVDPDNVSPEFLYLLSLYNEAGEADSADATATAGPKRASAGEDDETTWANIGPLLTTSWAQGSPYNDQCPKIGSTRCVTGCVATAMAQVLNYHKLPRTMHGTKTYGYTLDGTRYTNSFDFGATTFDWDNMSNTYGWLSTNAQKAAVAQLMYACGVASSMRYTTGESGTNTWVGTDAINYFMDGIRADHYGYDRDRILQELKAGRPVIYSGASSSGGAHCFVIDGCRSDGYFHCNLGWGGSNDGYFLPTDMAGYAVSAQAIEVVYPSDYVPTYTPIAELRGKFAEASSSPATTFEPNRWYALWNSGRAGSPKTDGVGTPVTNTSGIPTGEATELCANQLLRFVPRSGGGYYIQSGTGEYFGGVTMWGNCTAASSAINYFNVEEIQSGYFAIHSNGVACYIDTNGPGSTIVGWGNVKPSDIYSNSSWQFFPVTLTDTDPETGLSIGTGANFDNDKFYTLRNTGYSQGYLVAIGEDDAHPTLRGVTTDHSNGLYAGARYHDDPDVYNHGHYWRIITEDGKQYLVNYGTGKYLANSGNGTVYTFTSQKTPINIARMDDGTFRFNSGTDENSFLCAATHLDNPAAFWTYTDDGSVWQVEEATVQRPYVAVTNMILSHDSAVLFGGSTLQLSTTVLPTTATDASVSWTSSNSDVATVSAEGLVTAVGTGQAVIRATSVDNDAVTASASITVYGKARKSSMDSFRDGDVCLLRNVGAGSNRYSQGYLVALTPDATHPTLRGVEVVHPQHDCCDVHYKDAPDLFSPCSYWQIFTDGTTRYLYNVGVGKFLTNEGDQTAYVFTAEPKPINVTLATIGAFYFNSGTEAQSFLCAATHLDNPAAYWKSNDVGTYWSVEAVEGIDEGLVAPADYYDVFAQTIGDVARAVSRIPIGEATLETVEAIKRRLLRLPH